MMDMYSKTDDTSSRSVLPTETGPARRSQESLKGDILIVDDVPANLRLLSEMLTRQGFKVRSVINGHMALMAARAAPPDLILLDINMPGMNGYEVCQHLRADAETRDIPIIFISALDETADKVKAFTVGGMDYVTKPFQLEEVLARVETHLALRMLRTELQKANEELERRVEERTAQVVQLAVEKGRWERELQMAREVQASILPHETPQVPGWEFVAHWWPAREVAGDYYDFIAGEGSQLGLVIADVADKGMPAALFMVLTRSVIRATMVRAPTPADGIIHANEMLSADATGAMFVSLFYALLDAASGEVTYVNAGHNPPLLYSAARGELTQLKRTGMVLGIMPDAAYEQRTARLQLGDFLVLYTDGVPDATNPQLQDFGVKRLQQVVLDNRRASAAGMMAALEQAIGAFAGPADPFDDIAVMVIKRS